MRRVAHNLIAALLTFAIGVVIATSTHNKSDPVSDPQKDNSCNEWQNASNGLGWDLTYIPLLQKSGVCPGELYCEFASEKPQPPVDKIFAEWQGDPIISSILMEFSIGHGMEVLWLIRTEDKAYWWSFNDGHTTQPGMQPLSAQDYDHAFETTKCWKQHIATNKKFFDGSGDGYLGFLSLYEKGKTRQMLVASKDVLDPWTKEVEEIEDKARWGRFLKTFGPIYSAIEQQNQSTHVSK